MQNRFFFSLTLFFSCSFMLSLPAPAQTARQFNCAKEADPFASYCQDVNNFLATAGKNKVNGKIDQTNPEVKSALQSFLFVDSVPDRLVSLLARDVAFQDALNTLPKTPDSSAIGMATLAAANQNRPDKQTGAGTNANGTTDLVEKAGVPAILAFALESGSLIRSVNGTTASLNGNLDGIFRTITGQQALCFDCGSSFGTAILRDVGVSASYLINQQGTTPVTTNGSANGATPAVANVNIPSTVGKLSSIKARYQIWNAYDPRSPQFRAAWQKAVRDANDKINQAAQDFQSSLQTLEVNNPIKSDTLYQKNLSNFAEAFYADADNQNLDKLRQDFLSLFNATVDALKKDDPQFNQKLAGASVSLASYKDLWSQILNNAKGQPLLTLEYAFSEPQNQPESHDFRIISGYTPKNGQGLLSINAALSLYGGALPAGAKYGRIRDGQISAEFDRPFTLTGGQNQAAFSLAGYWQYQPDPTVLNITPGNLAPGTNIQLPADAQVLLGTAGSLWVVQGKVTINAKSGIKIPIGVKWSNKTDLLNGNKVGAQVGISYDFSSLSTLFGGQ
ncbi:MAG TPA: hypothetical protein VKZ53_09960 [Candidatus Angelobacter sp.]|nr:hypothetical protein [Candidatus Angelobacter sp.]